MKPEVFKSQQTQEVIKYVREKYGDELEFLWPKFSDNAIWRNKQNRKWYAVLLVIPKNRLGFPSDERAEIIDVRFSRGEALEFAASNEHIFPGYHMNKRNWITIILDGSVATEQILALLDQSYEISLRS